jgi:plasmid stabilization system protein ParE
MRVLFRARARADLEQINNYLENRSPLGAKSVARAIYAAVAAIGEHPKGSQKTDDPDVRVKTVQSYPYRIFYVHTEDDVVEILHVRHAARRPWMPDRGRR